MQESKEGIEVARGTPYNSNADSLASRSQGGEQRVARSEDDGASPSEGSSAEGDDSAASSMEYNDTYGSVAALFSYEHASKEWLRPSKEVCTRKVCLALASKDS